jgi:hypothetical protein
MMTYLKWIVGAVVVLAIGLGLYWTLPSRDVVRILGTEIARRSVETENAQGETVSRTQDVRYIKAVTPDGEPRVYRNEDTGWGWPPYFKFDSANLAAEADNLTSSEADPRWVVVTHYGWRIPLLSKFPNATSLKPADGPDPTLIPWFNIAVVVVLIVLVLIARHQVISFFRPKRT